MVDSETRRQQRDKPSQEAVTRSRGEPHTQQATQRTLDRPTPAGHSSTVPFTQTQRPSAWDTQGTPVTRTQALASQSVYSNRETSSNEVISQMTNDKNR